MKTPKEYEQDIGSTRELYDKIMNGEITDVSDSTVMTIGLILAFHEEKENCKKKLN